MLKDERGPKEARKSQNKEDGTLSTSTIEKQVRQDHLQASYVHFYGSKPYVENHMGMLIPVRESIRIKRRDSG